MTFLFFLSSCPALLHVFWSKGSQLHDDFPSVAERIVGKGTISSPTLLPVYAAAWCDTTSSYLRIEHSVNKQEMASNTGLGEQFKSLLFAAFEYRHLVGQHWCGNTAV